MQPYFLPYLGYYALLSQVDTFVVFDSAQFTRKGWIHRNQIPGRKGEEIPLVLPVCHTGDRQSISEMEISSEKRWREKMQRTLEQRYSQSNHFRDFFSILDPLWNTEERRLSPLLVTLLKSSTQYVGISCEWVSASELERENSLLAALKGEKKILEMVQMVSGTEYINLPGGNHLYRTQSFKQRGIKLKFQMPLDYLSLQETWPGVGPWSIVHEMATRPVSEIRKLLGKISLSK